MRGLMMCISALIKQIFHRLQSLLLHQSLSSLCRRSALSLFVILSLSARDQAHADDTYVMRDGDTVIITNQAPRKRRKPTKISAQRRGQSARVCFLENRRTGEQSLISRPTSNQLRRSKVIWCEDRVNAEDDLPPARRTSAGVKDSSKLSKKRPKRRGKKRSLPRRAEAFRGFVEGAAQKYQLPEALLWAFMKVESDFIPTAVSRKGAQGLMQLMPFTSRDMGVRDPFDPEQNIYGAAKLIGILMKRFQGELPLVISAYHAGGGAVTKREGIPYTETSQYMTSVLNAYYRYMKTPPYLRNKSVK